MEQQAERLRPVDSIPRPSPKRSKPRPRPTQPVPTDRLKFEVQTKILRIAALYSDSDFGTKELAELTSLAESTAGLNNRFYQKIGLFERVGKGRYRPTTPVLDYARSYSFEPEGASGELAAVFRDAWFFQSVEKRCAVGVATEGQLVEQLARECGTGSEYARQYEILLQWLEYVGLVSIVGGEVRVAGTKETPDPKPDAGSAVDDLDSGREKAPEAPKEDPAPDDSAVKPILQLSFSISLTADDLSRLDGPQIEQIFEGVGNIASLKKVLEN